MSIEELYQAMFTAFARYAKAEPLRRDSLWDAYVLVREQYLRTVQGANYRPLKVELH